MNKTGGFRGTITQLRAYLGAQHQALRNSLRIRRSIRKDENLRRAKMLRADPSTLAYLKQIDEYWQSNFGRKINPLWHLAYTKVMGEQDVRYIPGYIWNQEILPYLNDLTLRPAFLDKNLSDVFMRIGNTPKVVLKRMHRHYYVEDRILAREDVASYLSRHEAETFVVKGSRTDNGIGIRLFQVAGDAFMVNGVRCELADIEAMYGDDFLVQERIVQHPVMANVHPGSVNTIRVVTLRWQGDITVLMAIARFGVGGSLNDNLGSGGIACGVDPDGALRDRAFDKKGDVYFEHPTTGHSFAERLLVPNYPAVRDLAIELHRQIYHFDVVSWDIAIGLDSRPIFLEVNFRGGCDSYQFVCGHSLFGDLTESILQTVRDSR